VLWVRGATGPPGILNDERQSIIPEEHPLDPSLQFCPIFYCLHRGKAGLGNIRVHQAAQAVVGAADQLAAGRLVPLAGADDEPLQQHRLIAHPRPSSEMTARVFGGKGPPVA
jgi:hypothetical protein